MLRFPSMVEVIPEGRHGKALVEHFTFTEEESAYTRMRAAFGHPHEFCPPGRYARLRVNGQIWMTDTQMEQDSNREVLLMAHGDVFLAGLGLGMVAAGLVVKPSVTGIYVVEQDPDVIALVERPLYAWAKKNGSKAVIRIERADVHQYRPPRGTRFQSMYFDIWPDINDDNAKEGRALRRKFRTYLARGGWAGFWMED